MIGEGFAALDSRGCRAKISRHNHAVLSVSVQQYISERALGWAEEDPTEDPKTRCTSPKERGTSKRGRWPVLVCASTPRRALSPRARHSCLISSCFAKKSSQGNPFQLCSSSSFAITPHLQSPSSDAKGECEHFQPLQLRTISQVASRHARMHGWPSARQDVAR